MNYFQKWTTAVTESIPLTVIALRSVITSYLPEFSFESNLDQLQKLASVTSSSLQYLTLCIGGWQHIQDLLVTHRHVDIEPQWERETQKFLHVALFAHTNTKAINEAQMRGDTTVTTNDMVKDVFKLHKASDALATRFLLSFKCELKVYCETSSPTS